MVIPTQHSSSVNSHQCQVVSVSRPRFREKISLLFHVSFDLGYVKRCKYLVKLLHGETAAGSGVSSDTVECFLSDVSDASQTCNKFPLDDSS